MNYYFHLQMEGFHKTHMQRLKCHCGFHHGFHLHDVLWTSLCTAALWRNSL